MADLHKVGAYLVINCHHDKNHGRTVKLLVLVSAYSESPLWRVLTETDEALICPEKYLVERPKSMLH